MRYFFPLFLGKEIFQAYKRLNHSSLTSRDCIKNSDPSSSSIWESNLLLVLPQQSYSRSIPGCLIAQVSETFHWPRWTLDPLIDWLFNRLMSDWLIDCFIACSIEWLIDCFIACSIEWLIDWLIGFSCLLSDMFLLAEILFKPLAEVITLSSMQFANGAEGKRRHGLYSRFFSGTSKFYPLFLQVEIHFLYCDVTFFRQNSMCVAFIVRRRVLSEMVEERREGSQAYFSEEQHVCVNVRSDVEVCLWRCVYEVWARQLGFSVRTSKSILWFFKSGNNNFTPLIVKSIDRSTDQSIDWLIDRMFDQSIDWLIDRMFDWLIDWLVDLTDWFSNISTVFFAVVRWRWTEFPRTGTGSSKQQQW